jgi:hypothetical protein
LKGTQHGFWVLKIFAHKQGLMGLLKKNEFPQFEENFAFTPYNPTFNLEKDFLSKKY